MKKLGLAALLVALTTPAWAYNDDGERQAALNACRDAGDTMQVCGMKFATSEAEARDQAREVTTFCLKPDLNIYALAMFQEVRVYIKQRW